MRVAQINSHYDQSGAGKIVSCIHNELKRRGHDALAAYGRGDTTHDEGTYRIGSKVEIAFEGFATRILGVHGFTSWKATADLVKELERFRPDVVHLHGLHGYYLNFEILFKYINRVGVPCVWTFHDCHAFSGNCGYHLDCERWKVGCGECPHLRQYPTSLWFDHTRWMWSKKKCLYAKSDGLVVVSPSEWMTKDAKQSFFGKFECLTINNGIDTEHMFFDRGKAASREKHGYSPQERIALSIAFGFDNPLKGAEHLIELARNLQQVPVKVILIGWHPKDHALIEGLDNVVAIPFTSNQSELAEYYSLADVTLLPSLAENYATVTIESLACGTPVVGFNVGGIPEQLADGRGIVVEAGNQAHLERATRKILSGCGEVKSRQEIIDFTRQNNSVRTMVDQYMAVYERVISQVRSSRPTEQLGNTP